MLWRSILYSLLLHAVAGVLLVVSFDFSPQTVIPPRPPTEIVNAVAVDNEQVQAELDRLQEVEAEKQRQEQQREERLAELERQREAEQQRLEQLRQEQQQEERRRQQEQHRLAETRKQQQEAERQRQLEEEKRRQAETERQRAEEARQKALAEKQRLEEERRRAEEEALRKQQMAEEEQRMAAEQRRLEEEQRRREAAQAAADQELINQYGYRIQQAIRREFNTIGLPSGLSCVLRIRTIPGGDVVDVQVVDSSGNAVFDRRAVTAVRRASPLPVPEDPRVFEKMRDIRLTFAPEN